MVHILATMPQVLDIQKDQTHYNSNEFLNKLINDYFTPSWQDPFDVLFYYSRKLKSDTYNSNFCEVREGRTTGKERHGEYEKQKKEIEVERK